MKMRPPNACTLCRVLLVLLLCAERCVAVKWLALYRVRQRPWSKIRNCTKSVGLVSAQIPLCRDNLDLMDTVTESTLLTIDACQQQFSDRRWNCSSILKVPKLPRDLIRGTREQAFVYGISSAALVHSISRACSLGVSPNKCACGILPKSVPSGAKFKWGGCGDDLRYGMAFGEQFTDATLMGKVKPKDKDKSKKGSDDKDDNDKKSRQKRARGRLRIKTSKKALMNRHNFRVGRMVVGSSLIKVCKCHGVSGSCSVQTCWMGLPPFPAIGKALKDRYALAVEVKRKRRKRQKVLVPIRARTKKFEADELAYYEKSPDYCSPDPKTGSVGTEGRLCDPKTRGHGNCGAMCCGRGHIDFTMEIEERCGCKYIWCCYVKCNICPKTLYLSRCK